jgi:hypothetical protein
MLEYLSYRKLLGKIVKNYCEQSGYAIIDKQAFPALFKKMFES